MLNDKIKREYAYWSDLYASSAEKWFEEQVTKTELTTYFRREFNRAENMLHQQLNHPARVLIIGAGMGALSAWCSGNYPEWEIVSTDLITKGLSAHRTVARLMGYQYESHLVVSNWDLLPFKDASFDLCFADRCLHHMDDPIKSLSSIAKSIRPGGVLIALREPTIAIAHPETKRKFGEEARKAGANEHIWYLNEWRHFFTKAGFRLKVRIHLEDCFRFYRGWGPRVPGIRKLLRLFPLVVTERLLFPYVWYYGSTNISKFTFYAVRE